MSCIAVVIPRHAEKVKQIFQKSHMHHNRETADRSWIVSFFLCVFFFVDTPAPLTKCPRRPGVFEIKKKKEKKEKSGRV